jgi:hypothetical protein
MNAIRSYEPEYNVQCFFRDLPGIREKTFTVRTIKHAFQNAGIWPVSFKAVRRKLKEYGKKRRKDTGLQFLEFGSESETESDTENARFTTPAPAPVYEYQLPTLPKPPSSYNECVLRLDNLNNKILDALSSSPRKEYSVTIKATKNHLMLGSLQELDAQNARKAQVERYKAKLNARLSFQRGGWMNASDALVKKKIKVRKAAEEELKKAKKQLAKAESAEKEALKRIGVAARAAERERKKMIKDLEAQARKRVLGVNTIIPPELLIPIRDPQNEPTEDEIEAIRIKHQSLYDKVAKEQAEFDRVQAEDPAIFTDIPIDPAILASEQAHRAKGNPLSQLHIRAISVESGGSDKEMEEAREGINGGVSGGEVVLYSSPPRSVISTDSIAQNADFVALE